MGINMGIFGKLKSKISSVFSGGKLDDDFYESLEEALILSDVGAEASLRLTDNLRAACKKAGCKSTEEARGILRSIIVDMLSAAGARGLRLETKPSVILVTGVNGVGKTTTIGKLAFNLKKQGLRVLLCAGDTFRAAAADQLAIWAERAGVGIVRQNEGADPAGVLFDAIRSAKAQGYDVVICDTAGRLHNKQNLLNELAKMSRVIDKELPGASRENLMVLDAVTGQNGLLQVKGFTQSAGLTGLVLTKLDGSAKGGIVIAVADGLKLPVKLVGLGEGIEDLAAFEPETFVADII